MPSNRFSHREERFQTAIHIFTLYSVVVNLIMNGDIRFLPDTDFSEVDTVNVYSVSESSGVSGLKLKPNPPLGMRLMFPLINGEMLSEFLIVPESTGAVNLNVISAPLLNAILPFTGTVEDTRKGIVEKRVSKGEPNAFPN